MKRFVRTYGVYIAVTLAVMAPLLMPGYVLTLDLVFTPTLRMPESVSHDYVWRTLLHVLDIVLPSEIIQKAILISTILGASIGMHQLIVWMQSRLQGTFAWQWPVYAASIFFAINPFTYSRFMAGQYAVLLGYALLPFFVRFVLQFAILPSRQLAAKLLVVALAVSIISIHTVGELGAITLLAVIMGAWQHRTNRQTLARYVKYGGGAVVAFVMFSSYWLVPLALNHGQTATTINQFDASHTEAFATTGSNALAQLVNVLKLQGFWADARDLYLMPQEQLVGWGTIRLLVWGLVGYGAVILWRKQRSLGAFFGGLAVVAAILAIGFPDLTAIGYREPQKFTGLVALCFAVFMAIGSARLLQRFRTKSETRFLAGSVGVLLVVLLFTPTMYWGGVGQLKPRRYPADWQTVRAVLNQDKQQPTSLFLPWHQYMSFDFAGRIIANPAEQYFDTPVIVSDNPELKSLRHSSTDPHKARLDKIFANAKRPKNLTAELAALKVKYIILAHDYDHKTYGYLSQENLTVMYKGNDMTLYRNNAFKEGK